MLVWFILQAICKATLELLSNCPAPSLVRGYLIQCGTGFSAGSLAKMNRQPFVKQNIALSMVWLNCCFTPASLDAMSPGKTLDCQSECSSLCLLCLSVASVSPCHVWVATTRPNYSNEGVVAFSMKIMDGQSKQHHGGCWWGICWCGICWWRNPIKRDQRASQAGPEEDPPLWATIMWSLWWPWHYAVLPVYSSNWWTDSNPCYCEPSFLSVAFMVLAAGHAVVPHPCCFICQ